MSLCKSGKSKREAVSENPILNATVFSPRRSLRGADRVTSFRVKDQHETRFGKDELKELGKRFQKLSTQGRMSKAQFR